MDTATIKQAVELRKAHLNLIRYSLDKGHSITVHYGDGDDEVTMSRDFALIKYVNKRKFLNNDKRIFNCKIIQISVKEMRLRALESK